MRLRESACSLGSAVSESALRTALDVIVSESLRPISAGLSALYVIFAVSHRLVLPEAVAAGMVLMASGTAALLLGLYLVLDRWAIPSRWAHPIAAGMAGLVLLNSLVHLFLLSEPQQTTNLMLLAIGVGCFFLSTAWLVLGLAATFGGWALVAWGAAPSPSWLHFGFGLLSATVLSVLVHTVRVRTFRRLEGLRIQDEHRKRELEEALQVQQQSEEALRQAHTELELRVQERTAALADANRALQAEIVERKRAESGLLKAKEAAEAANRAKSEFLATMSHELRTPLNAILGYTDLLLEEAFGSLSEEQARPLRRTNRSAKELLDLITAVLDVSRLEAGRLPVEVQAVEVPALLEEIKAETQEVRERSGLEFGWKTEEHLPPLHTDSGKLKVVIKNLIGNAAKFTPEGSITVDAHSRNGGVEISVADTGVGIPPEALALIFEPFRQVNPSPTSYSEGTGLGLYIVKRLLEALGGKIEVESEVGHGSTFRVWVPTGEQLQDCNGMEDPVSL